MTDAMVLHAGLMLIAWGVLLPAGGILARYYKVTARQDFPAVVNNLFWWRAHRALQYAGLIMATIALGVILRAVGPAFDTAHAWCGLAVTLLGWAQVVSGWLRGSTGGPWAKAADPHDPATWRGDHFDMTARRLRFERWHKPLGWLVLALAGATILLGTPFAGSPAWLLMLVGLLQGAALLAILDGMARRRWVDTHAALWGPWPPASRNGDDDLSSRKEP